VGFQARCRGRLLPVLGDTHNRFPDSEPHYVQTHLGTDGQTHDSQSHGEADDDPHERPHDAQTHHESPNERPHDEDTHHEKTDQQSHHEGSDDHEGSVGEAHVIVPDETPLAKSIDDARVVKSRGNLIPSGVLLGNWEARLPAATF
jgi:hypothetical protein